MRYAWLRKGVILLLVSCTLPAFAQVNPHTQIRWPANCNSSNYMAYNFQANTCINVGPVGASGQVQVNQGGAWAVVAGLTYDFASNTLAAPNISVPGTSTVKVTPTSILWPSNCNSSNFVTYNYPSNSCFDVRSNITAGTTATLPPGSSATVTQTGTFPNFVLNFGIPQGLPGGSLSYPGVLTDGANGLRIAGAVTVNKRLPNLTAFVCEGDSITAGANTTGNNRYCDVVMTLQGLAGRGITYTNVATNGANIGTITSRYAASVKPKCQAGGTILHVAIGTNDIGALNHTDVQTWTDLQAYVNTAKADGCTVSVSTILPRINSVGWTATMEGYRQSVNTSIRNWNVPDFKPDFDHIIQNSQDPTVFTDGLHPNDSAHALMADVLDATLRGTQAYKPIVFTPVPTLMPTYPNAVNLAAGTDLNTIKDCGIYDGSSLVNGPAALGTNWMHLLVLCSSTSATGGPYEAQIATSFGPGAGTINQMFMRIQVTSTSTWTAWTQIVPFASQWPQAAQITSGTDLNTITQCGIYDGQNMPNAPSTAFWHVQVFCNSATLSANNYVAQLATLLQGTATPQIWYRYQNAGTWNAWFQIFPGLPQWPNAVGLATSTDLNTITQCGIYEGQSLTNAPSSAYWHLQVFCNSTSTSNGYIGQLATSMLGTAAPQLWYRYSNGGTWNAWTPISTSTLAITTGVTGSIGGSSLAPGACTSGTATATAGSFNLATFATPASGAGPGAGFVWNSWVSTANTVTVQVCNITAAAATPTAVAYNVRVMQ